MGIGRVPIIESLLNSSRLRPKKPLASICGVTLIVNLGESRGFQLLLLVHGKNRDVGRQQMHVLWALGSPGDQ